MSPTLYLSIDEMEYEGKLLLWVYVPPTSVVEKCSGRIFDRNEDGDMDITESPIQLQNMYNRKSTTYTEHNDMIKKNKTLSVEEVMAELSISRATVFRDYAKISKITGAIYDKKTGEWKY